MAWNPLLFGARPQGDLLYLKSYEEAVSQLKKKLQQLGAEPWEESQLKFDTSRADTRKAMLEQAAVNGVKLYPNIDQNSRMSEYVNRIRALEHVEQHQDQDAEQHQDHDAEQYNGEQGPSFDPSALAWTRLQFRI
ncbi:hypothetical protein WJX72_005934 [[Myrmecia] bisecta]|uniref:Uncharacterized protein n=1 Tax=[Myrmecia] bisecta TaxID=41462 RepID=A0AAW1QAL3_9CHLO